MFVLSPAHVGGGGAGMYCVLILVGKPAGSSSPVHSEREKKNSVRIALPAKKDQHKVVISSDQQKRA
jgi:hypothetical protein